MVKINNLIFSGLAPWIAGFFYTFFRKQADTWLSRGEDEMVLKDCIISYLRIWKVTNNTFIIVYDLKFVGPVGFKFVASIPEPPGL